MFALAEKFLPGAGLGGYALSPEGRFVFQQGKGARLWDVEGREYIDYVCGAGALIAGHAHPAVTAAAREQAALGGHMFGVLNETAIRLAERLVCDIPCAEKVLYATTGSEATAYAMRLARASTGREKIIKFEGAYHGNHDYALVSTFPRSVGNYPYGRADTGGQPLGVRESIVIAPYNDLATTTRLAEEQREDLAGIIVEPVQRIVRGEADFLAGLRALCDRLGCLLLFDEVVTGFRIAYGGAHAALGITPDLASFGKVVGGSGPLAAVVGRAEVIDLADPGRKGEADAVYVNGTLHGNPMAARMTLAVLDILQPRGVLEDLDKLTADFCVEAQKIFDRHSVSARALCVGSMWQFLFTDKSPRSYADILASDMGSARRLDEALLREGHYVLPGVRRFFSIAHGQAEAEETLTALDGICHKLF